MTDLSDLQAIRVSIMIRLRVIELRVGSRGRSPSRSSTPGVAAPLGQRQGVAAGVHRQTSDDTRSGRPEKMG